MDKRARVNLGADLGYEVVQYVKKLNKKRVLRGEKPIDKNEWVRSILTLYIKNGSLNVVDGLL